MPGCKHRKGVVEGVHLLAQGQPLNQLQDSGFHIRHELILSTPDVKSMYLRIMNYTTKICPFLLKQRAGLQNFVKFLIFSVFGA